MHVQPTPQHEWLRQLVGTWTIESSCDMGDGSPPMTSTAREVVRAMGELWIIAEMTGEIPGGGAFNSIMTLGYDSAKERFVGSWAGTPMTNMFVYDGALDAAQKTLTLSTPGPGMEDPTKTCNYEDVIELVTNDERLFHSQMQLDDGTWNRFMTGVYRREA
ncbi:MAG: DUF1579 domain-containing protein [Planctomycetota bacterium]